MVRPSSNSNVSLLSVIWIDMISGGGVLFRFIPRLPKLEHGVAHDKQAFERRRLVQKAMITAGCSSHPCSALAASSRGLRDTEISSPVHRSDRRRNRALR